MSVFRFIVFGHVLINLEKSSNAVVNYSVSAHYIVNENNNVVNNIEFSHRPSRNENNYEYD